MAETTNRTPREVETLNYQVGGVDEGAVQVKKNRSSLFRQLLSLCSRIVYEARIIVVSNRMKQIVASAKARGAI